MAETLGVVAPLGIFHPFKFSPAQKLRLVITDGCNYSCSFCHNEGALPVTLSTATMMSLEMAHFLCDAALLAGVKSIKLTGGEPLTWRSGSLRLPDLVGQLAASLGKKAELSLTTNGQLLSPQVRELYGAGLRHVTISLHTLSAATFRRVISSSGSPARQLDSVSAAVDAGLSVKANVVVLPETASEIPALCQELFSRGAQLVRLYRVLWTPYLGDDPALSRVDDDTLISLAFESVGLGLDGRANEYLRSFLASADPGLPASAAVQGVNGTIELDRMPDILGRDPSLQEGPYAVRLGPNGDLRGRLYSTSVSLAPYFLQRDFEKAAEAIRGVGNALDG